MCACSNMQSPLLFLQNMQLGEVYAKSAKSQQKWWTIGNEVEYKKPSVVWSWVGDCPGPRITLGSYGLLGGGHLSL